MTQVHHTTHTEVVEDLMLDNRGTRGHYTRLSVLTQHMDSGSLHNICVIRAALQSQLSVARPEFILVQKANRQFHSK